MNNMIYLKDDIDKTDDDNDENVYIRSKDETLINEFILQQKSMSRLAFKSPPNHKSDVVVITNQEVKYILINKSAKIISNFMVGSVFEDEIELIKRMDVPEFGKKYLYIMIHNKGWMVYTLDDNGEVTLVEQYKA